MELECAVVFTLVSLLSVTATPHGYGAKGGAVARAEAGAAAGAFGGIGLPLSIQSGPGFSGSFSKSSSSSFASSSASSSSSSFSFSGSGAGGFGLNSLGATGNGGCSGGCQRDSKGISDSNGTGSATYGLQTINGVKSNAAAGASAGSYIDSKAETHSPCSNGVCPGKKSQCDGPNCKNINEACKSGQCGPSSEKSSSDTDQKDCSSGQCNTNTNYFDSKKPDCENGKCGGNNNIAQSSYNNNNCASGQCSPPQSTGNFGTSGPSVKPERDNGYNDIPVTITSSSASLHDSSQSDTPKTSTIGSQTPGVDCKNGNCDSLRPSTKPSYGYSSTIAFNENQPQTTLPGSSVTPTKPATHLTLPKEEEPCTHQNCKSSQLDGQQSTSSNLSPGKVNCNGGFCDDGQSHKNPIPTTDFSDKGDSQQKNPSFVQVSTDQKSNNVYPSTICRSGNCDNPSNSVPSLPKIPDNSQTHSPIIPDNDICVTGNCGSRPSYQSSPDIHVAEVSRPTQSQGFDYSPNCPSGNCNSSPKQPIPSTQPTISHYPKQTSNENCPSGNCGNPFNSSPSQSNIPNYAQGYSPIKPNNCASGNCGTYPSYQNNFDIQVSKVPTQTDFSLNPSYPINGNTNHCQSGTCSNYPSNDNLGSSYPRLPSYPQNILPTKPLNCASGNCANYPSAEIHPSVSSIGSKLPHPSEQPALSSPAACVSGTCGNNPIYQQGSLSPSGYQNPSYAGAVPTPICASGNCAVNPTISGEPGPKIPPQSIGSSPTYTSSTGEFSSGASTGFISGSSNCASGKCPSYPTTQSTSHQTQPTSTSPNKLPDYVALGTAGGAVNTGSFVPSSISSSQPTVGASHTTSNSGIVGGTNSQSSIFSNDNDKEQVYTGGFGGPPGILKPYEFTAPSPQLPSHNKKEQEHQKCSTGKCDAQSEGDNFSNKYDLPSHTRPCTSGKCASQPGQSHYGQSNTASGAFAAAAAGSEGVIYTGGFGGPPGILKPFDGGKIGNIGTFTAVKHQTPIGSNNEAVSVNKLNGGYGAFSGASATANAGIFGSGSYGENNKAGGCSSGCGSLEHGSFGGNFGLAGGLSKSGLLEKIHNGLNGLGAVAQSAAGAISGAGSNSFAVGGSFASSSAAAQSVAGSATKGGYGR